MKKILGLFFMLLVITGCSGGKETTTVCKSSGTVGEEITIKGEGDEVTTFTSVITTDFISQGYELTDEEAIAVVEANLEAVYSDLKGVTYKIDKNIENGVVIATIEIDYTKADLDELYKKKIVNTKGADYISLEKTIESIEKDNFSCKEK